MNKIEKEIYKRLLRPLRILVAQGAICLCMVMPIKAEEEKIGEFWSDVFLNGSYSWSGFSQEDIIKTEKDKTLLRIKSYDLCSSKYTVYEDGTEPPHLKYKCYIQRKWIPNKHIVYYKDAIREAKKRYLKSHRK